MLCNGFLLFDLSQISILKIKISCQKFRFYQLKSALNLPQIFVVRVKSDLLKSPNLSNLSSIFGNQVHPIFLLSESNHFYQKAIYFGFVNFRCGKIKIKFPELNRRNYFQNLTRKCEILNPSISLQNQQFLAFAQRFRVCAVARKNSKSFKFNLKVSKISQTLVSVTNLAIAYTQC